MAELEAVIKKDYMVKRSQGLIKTETFRERWFILTLHFLRCCDGTTEGGPDKTKEDIELDRVMVVETVEKQAFEKPNVFQVVYASPDKHDLKTLYVQATHEAQRDSWIQAIRDACRDIGVTLDDKYHPGVYRGGKYTCCSSQNRLSQGCSKCSV